MASLSFPTNLMMSSSDYSPLLSVQELVNKPLHSIPHQYIRDDDHHHESSSSSSSPAPIPIIDMNLLLSGDDEDHDEHTHRSESELHKLHLACTDWGIFQLVNHGVSPEELEELRNGIEGFFKLPLEEKMKYKIRAGEVEGYGTVIKSPNQKLDWGDRLYMTVNPLHTRKPYLLPDLPSSLRSKLEIYIEKVQKMGMAILGLLEKAVRMEGKEMRKVFEDGLQSVRMTYYPACPQPEKVMGFGAHSDATGITILNQVNGVSGLQIKKDDVWLPIDVLPNALIVNVGDILEIMSNGLYKSVEHRAKVNSNKERISLAYFFLPKYGSEIGPAMSLLSPQNPPLFRRIAMEKYVSDFFSIKLNGKSYLEHMRIKTPNSTNTI
ncbi:Protein SRG1 [Senna tora]|uniref:Protein SRG1 n=1 Tax=Senna tora TaxID=362788 RepID=A0A834VZG0_9FABA|nr:Protein SRG1 [Senna tora]